MSSVPHDSPEFNGDFWAARAAGSGYDRDSYADLAAASAFYGLPDGYEDEPPCPSDAEMFVPDDAFEPTWEDTVEAAAVLNDPYFRADRLIAELERAAADYERRFGPLLPVGVRSAG